MGARLVHTVLLGGVLSLSMTALSSLDGTRRVCLAVVGADGVVQLHLDLEDLSLQLFVGFLEVL